MNCAPTITAAEFRQLHNGLCELDSMVSKLLHGNVYEGQKLEQIANTLRDSLKGAYEQDDEAFQRKRNRYDSAKSDLGIKHSEWSIFEVDNLGDRHPYHDADRVVYQDHWGDKPVYCSSIHGLTWAALWVAADACIRDSGDDHHVYVERFKPAKDDPRTLVLTTGS